MGQETNLARRRLAALALVGIGVPLVWYLWNRSHQPPDAEQIRRCLATAQEGIEGRSLRKAMSIVSEDYKDEEGNDRRELVRMAAGAFQYARSISVHIGNLDIKVEGEKAASTCDVTVVFADNPGDQLEPLRVQQTQGGRVQLGWRKERGAWKVVSLRGWHYAEHE